jgi:hypothetical protein
VPDPSDHKNIRHNNDSSLSGTETGDTSSRPQAQHVAATTISMEHSNG